MDPNSLEISVPPDKPGFKICLDDIDLNLLHSYETTVPLYTLQSREYIDFEVYSQEILSLPDEENLENENLRRCYICEVDVPVSYWECHKTSSKHQVYNAITQISLDRLRKQTELDVLPLPKSVPKASTYYCDICSQAIHCTQQDSHNASDEHVTNKNRDEMIKKLMLVYKNPSEFVKIFEETEVIKEEKHDPLTKIEKKLEWWDEVFLYPKKVNPLTTHKIHYIDDFTIAIITKCEEKFAVNFDNFHGFRDDKTKIVCHVCCVSVDNKYTHMNDDGHIKKITAAIEDQHCIRQLNPKSNHCILCNEMIDNREEHISTERHESFLKQATIDDDVYTDMKEDFERYDTKINTQQNWWDKVFLYPKKVNPLTAHKIQYIDDYTIEVGVKSGAKLAVNFDNFHGFCEDDEKIICRVCRALVDDKYTHMEDDGHIKKITAAIEDKHCIRRLDQIFNHCILCNEIIENSEVHISTESHEAALTDCMIDDTNEFKKTLAENCMSVSTFDQRVYFCNACQIYVEQNSLTHHINEEYHTESLGKSKKRRRAIQFRINTASNEFCTICNVSVTGGKKAMKAHKKTDGHKYLDWLTKKYTKLHHHFIKVPLVANNITCRVCKIIITADQPAKEEHIASIRHQDEYKQLLQQNKMETLDHKYVSCHACDTLVLTFEDLKHIQKKTHRKCLQKKQVAVISLQSGIDQKVTSAESQKIILNGLQKRGNDFNCTYCNVTIEKKYIDEHIKCELHLSSKLKHNVDSKEKQKNSLPENSAAFKIHFNKISQDDNEGNLKEDTINSREALYEKLKEEVFDFDYCTVCKVQVNATKQSRQNHLIWTDHRYQFYLYAMEKGARFHHHMKETFGLDNLTCKICKIQVEPDHERVQRHIDSDEHVARYKSLTQNLIEKISESRVKCLLCNLSMFVLEEISHLSTKRHKKKVSLRERGYVILGPFYTVNESIVHESISSDTSEKLEDIDEEKMRNNELIKTGTEYYCNACCVTLEHSFVAIHIDSDMHLINISQNKHVKANYIQENIAVKPKRNKTLHYVYDFDNNFDVKCKICNVGVTFDRMVKHRQEESHKEKFRDVLEVNTMFRIHYISFCECCMEILTLNLEYEHFTSEKHIKNLSILKNRMDRTKVLNIAESMFRKYDSSYQRIKGKRRSNPVSRPKDSGTIADAINDSSTSDDYQLLNKTLVFNKNISLDADKLDYCDSESSFASALTSITETNPSNTNEVAAEKNYKSDEESSNYSHLFREVNPKQLICEICKSFVSFGCDLVTEHVQGKKHRKQYLSYLAANDIKESPDNEDTLQKYYCYKCGIDFPKTELFPHVSGKTHYTEISQPSASFPQAASSKDVTVFSFIPDISMYYWCKSYANDPLYLLSTISKNSSLTKTLGNQSSNSAKQNITLDTPIYYWRESYDSDPFYLLSTLSQGSNLLEALDNQSGKSTKRNICLDIPMHYCCDRYDQDPFYLMSTVSQKLTLPSVLDTPRQSNENVKQNCTPGKSSYYLFKSYENDPFYLLSTILQNSELVKAQDSNSRKKSNSRNSTKQNFARDMPMYYWCESYDKDPLYLMSIISQKSKLPSMLDTRSQSNENVKENCIPGISTYHWYENCDKDPLYLMSTILYKSKSPKMLDNQSNESKKQNTEFEHQETRKDDCSDESIKLNTQLVSQENRFSNVFKDNTESRSDESTKQKAQLESQDNSTFSKYLRDNQLHERTKLNTQPEPQENTFSNILRDNTESRFDQSNKLNVQLDCQEITKPEHQENTFSKVLREDMPDGSMKLNSQLVSQQNTYANVLRQKKESREQNEQLESEENTFSKYLRGRSEDESNETKNLNTELKSLKDTYFKYIRDRAITNNYCLICEMVFPEPNASQHIAGKMHRDILMSKGFCSFCEVEVPGGDENIEVHVRGADHIKNKAIAEKNTNTTKSAPGTSQSQKLLKVFNKLQSNDSLDSKRRFEDSYCHVCQVKLPDGASGIMQHVTGARHSENLEKHTKTTNAAPVPLKPLVKNAGSVPTNHVVNGFCSICKVKVPTGSNNIAEHVKGARHLENVAIAEKHLKTTNSASATSQNQKDLGVYNSIPNSNEQLCTVCNVKVSNSKQNLEQHLKGALHKENLEIVKMFDLTSTNERLCKVCKVKVPNKADNMYQHLKGQNHIRNAEKSTSVTQNTVKKAVPSPTEPVLLTKSTATESSVSNYLCQAENDRVISRTFVAGNSGSVPTNHVVNGYCSVCKVKVPSGSNNIAAHVKGARHLENVAVAIKHQKTTNNASATSQNQKDLGVYNSIPNSNEQVCTVCNVKVFNSKQNLEQHLKGALHKENLDFVKMFDLTSTNERLCKVCKVKVPNKADNMYQHLNGQNHKLNVEKSVSGTNNTATKTLPTETQSVLLTNFTTSSSNSSHLRYISEGVYCDLCNVNMTNLGAVVSHLNSKQHISFFKKWEQEHLAPETTSVSDILPTSLKCVSSSTSTGTPMSTSAETSCTNSRDSSAMRQNANNNPKAKASTNAYTCKICNVDVPNTPNCIKDHNSGNRHKKNVIKNNSSKEINTAHEGEKLSLNKQDDSIPKVSVSETTNTSTQVPNYENINNPSTSHDQNNKDCNTSATVTASNDIKKEENKNTEMKSEDEDGFYICKICKILVDNNPTAIHSHLNSYKHKSNNQEIKEKMKEDSQDPKPYFCEVCRCELLDDPIKIKTHNDSLHHMKKFLTLLSLNKIRIRDNKVCYCELCDLYFNKFSVLSHIEREKHKKMMA